MKIAAFTQFLLGPAAVQYLADMGANVVKVEPTGTGAWERGWAGGDMFVNGVSMFYIATSRNLRSLTLNLKTPAGVEAARRLIAGSDVVVENFRPGVMDRLGIGYDACRALNGRIVYARASGFGAGSPYRHLPGQDLVIQAMSGLAANTGRAGQPPTPVGAAVVDQHGGCLLAMGILAALFNRERTGEGQLVDVVMLQAALDLQLEPTIYHLNGAHLDRPDSAVADTFHQAPYGFYRTRDGYVALSLVPVKAVSAALGNPPELEPFLDPRVALAKRNEIARALEPLLEARGTDEWLEILRGAGIWCAPVKSMKDALADPAIRHLEPAVEVEHPRAGKIRVLKHPVSYSSGEATVERVAPDLGEHTREVLMELGYSSDEVAEMQRRGEA